MVCPGPITTNIEKYLQHKEIGWFARNMMQSSRVVAELAIKGALKGKGVIIPGVLNKVLKVAASLVPDFLQNRLTVYSMKQLKQEKEQAKEVVQTELPDVSSISA